jgi:hypothetical protein
MNRAFLFLVILFSLSALLVAQEPNRKAARPARTGKIETPAPTQPPLQPVDTTKLPPGTEQFDIYLLTGQSNMKGRGIMPDEPKGEPRIAMMHLIDDAWYLARHPLHLTGDAKTFAGHDNAGVGPGLAFAEVMLAKNPRHAVGLIPCAVGGTPIERWEKGAVRYEAAIRRAKLALQTTASIKGRIRGVLWLQGEANANSADLPVYEAKLIKLINDLRADLAEPELPFIACTIGEMGDNGRLADQAAMNAILLAISKRTSHAACVDARDLKSSIGDDVHYDTIAQTEIGKRYAAKLIELQSK